LQEASPIQNDLKQHALRPIFFYLIFEYAIREAQENEKGLRINGAHSFWPMLMMLIY
jgi:hypothetical protein